MPTLSWKEVCKKLNKLEWEFSRDNDNHVIMVKKGNRNNISIPKHRVVSPGVMRSIIKLADLTVEKFIDA